MPESGAKSSMTAEELAAWEREMETPRSLVLLRAGPTLTSAEEDFWEQRQRREPLLTEVYEPKQRTCPQCGIEWMWTRKQQSSFATRTRKGADPTRPPVCSRACNGRRPRA